MSSLHGQILRKNHGFLEKHLDPTSILKWLRHGEVFTEKERRVILASTTRKSKANILLNCLGHKSHGDFELFLQALQQTKQDQILHVLNKMERLIKLEQQVTGEEDPVKVLLRTSLSSSQDGRPWSRSSQVSRSSESSRSRSRLCGNNRASTMSLTSGMTQFLKQEEDSSSVAMTTEASMDNTSSSSTALSTVSENHDSRGLRYRETQPWDLSRPLPSCGGVNGQRTQCLLAIGYKNAQGHLVNDILAFRVGEKTTEVVKLGELGSASATINWGMACCTWNNKVYISALGKNCDQLWCFEPDTREQRECGRLWKSKMGHCMGTAQNNIYILGGTNYPYSDPTDLIEEYDPHGKEVVPVAKLVFAVCHASCSVVGNKIYLYGGYKCQFTTVDHVQCFDVTSRQCTLLLPLASAASNMLVHQWGPLTYLFGEYHCFIYDTESEICVRRTSYNVDMKAYGMIPVKHSRDMHIYILGGFGANVMGNEVKMTPLSAVTLDKQDGWHHLGRMPGSLGLLSSQILFDIPDSYFKTYLSH